MQLTGQAVKHKVFGKGVITDSTENEVTVLFEKCEKKFMYPDAFSKYLTLKNDKLQDEVKEEIIEEKQEEQLEKDKINAKYERLDKLRSIKNSSNSQAVFSVKEDEVEGIINDAQILTGVYASGDRKGKPKQAVRIKPNSACVITTLKDGEAESERRVAGIFMVDENFYGTNARDGIIKGHEKYKVLIPDNIDLKLWDYDDSKAKVQNWGKTSFKYLSNTSVANIIYELASLDKTDFSKTFYKYFCLVNQLPEKEIN